MNDFDTRSLFQRFENVYGPEKGRFNKLKHVLKIQIFH